VDGTSDKKKKGARGQANNTEIFKIRGLLGGKRGKAETKKGVRPLKTKRRDWKAQKTSMTVCVRNQESRMLERKKEVMCPLERDWSLKAHRPRKLNRDSVSVGK